MLLWFRIYFATYRPCQYFDNSERRTAVNDPWVSGWGPGRELLCAVQTASSHRAEASLVGSSRSQSEYATGHACKARETTWSKNTAPARSTNRSDLTFGSTGLEDFEGSSCIAAAGLALAAIRLTPSPSGSKKARPDVTVLACLCNKIRL